MVLAILNGFGLAFSSAQASVFLSAPASSSKKRADCLVLEFDLANLIFLFVIYLLFCLFGLCLCSDKACVRILS